MAIFHLATITPTKAELMTEWLPSQPWGPATGDGIEVIGSFRFDDPEGRVGMENHIVQAGDTLLQVPLTYRDEPLAGAADGFIAEMEHSVLGTRWVYDGLRDPRFVLMLAAATLTGQGEAVGMAQHEGQWYVSPTNVRIHGGGWTKGAVMVDGFTLESDSADVSILRNERFDLTIYRRPVTGERPPIGLTATWADHDPVVLSQITSR